MSKCPSLALTSLSLALFSFLTQLAWAGEPQWMEIHSPHFSVVTDAGEKRGRETAVKFEQMRAVFGAMLAKAKVNLPIPLQIIAFRNTKELRQFAPLFHGKPTQVSGLFQAGEDRNFILLDMSVQDPWTVVFHEYAHMLMNGNLKADTQPWFEEGFAEYFSSIEVDAKEAKLGARVPPGDLEALQQYGLMRVSDLFRVQHDSKTYNEGDRRSTFYAESWLIVHYLYDTRQIPQVGTYFDVIDQKLTVEDAIQKAFGMTAAQFDKTIRNYLSGGRMHYAKIATPPGIETTGYSVASLSAVNAKAVLADAHLHAADYQERAVDEFEQVLAADANNAAALRGLGYAALRKHDFGHAGDYFHRAVQADSKDARVYYYSALLANQEDEMTRDPEKLNSIKQDLSKSIALDPTFADSYALLAYAHMSLGEHADAIASMKKAMELSPRNEQYLFNLSQMYLVSGQADNAVSILQSLTNSSNPEVAARAHDGMEQVQKMRVVLQAAAEHRSPPVLQIATPDTVTTPKVITSNDSAEVHEIPAARPPKFLKGQLVSVDCSHKPSAVLTVISGGKTLTMKVADTRQAIVIGADEFSCAWTQKKVAVNYRQSAEGDLNVMTVEIQ
ncbi:MAG TPA: tetratricopeptide repeat protein [Terriglobales bacterium]|nr:tetratricopeptide repeat protein [Terriglobales bacterium]